MLTEMQMREIEGSTGDVIQTTYSEATKRFISAAYKKGREDTEAIVPAQLKAHGDICFSAGKKAERERMALIVSDYFNYSFGEFAEKYHINKGVLPGDELRDALKESK